MRLALLAVVVACGGKLPPGPIAVPPVAPAETSCIDVGAILRGPVAHADDAVEAGRAREAVIANACEVDHWPASMLQCVATAVKPIACLARLASKQRESYDEKLDAWAQRWGGDSYGGDAYGGDEYGVEGGVVGGVMTPPTVTCTDAVGATALYPPLPMLDADDKAWDRAMRQHALEQLCERDGWALDVRNCLGPTGDTDPATCVPTMPVDQRDHITAKLAEIDGVAAKLALARKQPKQITCDKVAAAHYADARWKDKVDWIKGKERTRIIASSRDLMKKACAANAWGETLRACVVVADQDACFAIAGQKQPAWPYPALGVAITTGIPECDAWGYEVAKLMTCDKLPQATRDALNQAFQDLARQGAQTPEQRGELAPGCRAATDAIRQIGEMCP